jgi:hypothetical protein
VLKQLAEEICMKNRAVIALIALVGVASVPTTAHAGDGGAVAAGVIGGLAVGALAGAAIADSQRAPAHVYTEERYVPVYRPSRRVRVYEYAPHYVYDPGYSYDAYYHWRDY